MKISTVLAVGSAATALSGTVSVPDSSDDVQDVSIADGATSPPGEKIQGDNPFSLCKGDRSHDVLKIAQVDLVPNPPVRGEDLKVSAMASFTEPIQPGSVLDVKVRFIGSVVYHKRFDICQELEKWGQSCPVAPADVVLNETYPIPKKGFPHGSYGVNAFARFPDGRPITCIDGKLKL